MSELVRDLAAVGAVAALAAGWLAATAFRIAKR